MTHDYKVLIPSFTVEKSTNTLNTAVWGFVGVISMFTVGIGAFVLHTMLASMLEIANTFISDNMEVVDLNIIMFFDFIFGIGLFCFFLI